MHSTQTSSFSSTITPRAVSRSEFSLRVNRFLEAAASLQAALKSITLPNAAKSHTEAELGERIARKRYACKANMQICALMSRTGDHATALSFAKHAARAIHSSTSDSLLLCRKHTARFKAAQSTAVSESEFRQSLYSSPAFVKTHELVTSAMPTLQYMESAMKGKKFQGERPKRMEARSVLGLKHYNDWIFSYDFKTLLDIQPMTLFELKHCLEAMGELARDLLLEKVCLLAAAYYCVASETRCLAATLGSLSDARNWHELSLKIAHDLLPQESPLLQHIQSSFEEIYSQPVSLSPIRSRDSLLRSMSAKGCKRETFAEKWGNAVRGQPLTKSQLLRSSSRSPERGKSETSRTVMRKSASQTVKQAEDSRLAAIATTRRRRVISKSPIARRATRN